MQHFSHQQPSDNSTQDQPNSFPTVTPFQVHANSTQGDQSAERNGYNLPHQSTIARQNSSPASPKKFTGLPVSMQKSTSNQYNVNQTSSDTDIVSLHVHDSEMMKANSSRKQSSDVGHTFETTSSQSSMTSNSIYSGDQTEAQRLANQQNNATHASNAKSLLMSVPHQLRENSFFALPKTQQQML